MMAVNLGALVFGPSQNVIMSHLERISFPNGETLFTFMGRVMVDAALVFLLWFFMGRILLAILTGGIVVAVAVLKEREPELFQEVFTDSDGAGLGGTSGGTPGDWSGGYQSVDT